MYTKSADSRIRIFASIDSETILLSSIHIMILQLLYFIGAESRRFEPPLNHRSPPDTFD